MKPGYSLYRGGLTMKRFLSIWIVCQSLMFSAFLPGAEEFKRIDHWAHDETFGRDFFSFIDSDNHVVGGFYMIGCRMITPEKIVKFAPRGEGPGDLITFSAAFPYKDKGDIIIFEMPGRAKIFTKKNGTYAWKETRWFKLGKYAHKIKEGIFFDNKFFLTGEEQIEYKNNKQYVSLLKVYDDNGQPLKQLIRKTFTTPNRFYEMQYHIAGYKTDRVFFLQANTLNVKIVSTKNLEIIKEVDLEVPGFYKKMPEDFYVFKKYNNPKSNFLMDLETWATGYSSITEAAVDGNWLVVQVRTCSTKEKKFALLFYNIEKSFKLEKTVFTDDFLLDVKDGKYYCFANGDPGRDDDTDQCIINIYAWQTTK